MKPKQLQEYLDGLFNPKYNCRNCQYISDGVEICSNMDNNYTMCKDFILYSPDKDVKDVVETHFILLSGNSEFTLCGKNKHDISYSITDLSEKSRITCQKCRDMVHWIDKK